MPKSFEYDEGRVHEKMAERSTSHEKPILIEMPLYYWLRKSWKNTIVCSDAKELDFVPLRVNSLRSGVQTSLHVDWF